MPLSRRDDRLRRSSQVTSNLPDLFPGFDRKAASTDLGDIHCRVGGNGPPLLLIHGYPQTHAMWHLVAPALAETHTLVLPDLPGYGASSIPALSATFDNYSKRATAAALVSMMKTFGHDRFQVVGHDRGARVAYRMALDHANRVLRLAVLDILPTYDYWRRMDRGFGLKVYHWMFLAQPAPFPETLISASPVTFLEHTLASWTAAKELSVFDARALIHYRTFFSQPDRVAATCEDYRAGAGPDLDHDTADVDNGIRIKVPLLSVWGNTGIAEAAESPLDVWRRWAETVSGQGISGGHFVAEENPNGLLTVLLPFLEGGR